MTITSKSDRDRIRQKASQKRKETHPGRNEANREMSNAKREAGIRYLGSRSKDADAEWMRQIEIMPRDTRGLTGQLLGDPIPNDPRRPWLQGGA